MAKIEKCGIYRIICIPTRKFYVGSSVKVYTRWSQHRAALRRGTSNSLYLQNVWTKYGEENFRFEIIEECSREELEIREQHYIDTLLPQLNMITSVRERMGPIPRAKIAAATRARAALITHCPHGHEYTDENRYRGKSGARICKTCNAERVAAIYAAETPEQREERRQRVKDYQDRSRPERLVKLREYTARTKEQKKEYDRLHRLEANERRKLLREQETDEERAERLRKKRAAHHRKLGRSDPDAVSRPHNKGKPMSEEQKAKVSASLTEFYSTVPRKIPPWQEAGMSKTAWYRRLKRAAETPADTERRRAERRAQYHQNADQERENMRQRYRKRVAEQGSA